MPSPTADKLLAEWFWTDRWTGSSAFLLPIAARGLYREMLTQAWRRGARLPNDPEAIRRAVGVTAQEWSASWPKVKRFWRIIDDHIVNDTQVEIYAITLDRHESAVNRGSKGGRAHAQALAKLRAKPVADGKPPDPSPSPSPDPSPDPDSRIGVQADLKARAHTTSTANNGARAYQTTAIIGRNPHLNHIACDHSLSYCVPAPVHHKLAGLLAPKHEGNRDLAAEMLRAWYPTVWAGLMPGFVMGDAFRFWQSQFDAAFASATAPKGRNEKAMIALALEAIRKDGTVA